MTVGVPCPKESLKKSLAVAVLGVAIWSIKRHKDPHLELKSEAPLRS
jgi:hypothetical protein